MKIGIAGPISTESIVGFIDGDVSTLPVGYGGAPLLGTLIGELLARGHHVSAYTTSADLPLNLPRPVIAQGERFKIYYCPQRKHSIRMNGWHLGRIVDFFRLERRYLQQAIDIDKPDVVHAHWAYEFALAAIASGQPYVVTCHDAPDVVLKFTPNIYRFGRYLMARHCLRQANIVTAVSPYLRDAVQKYCKVPIAVVQNPLPDFLFENSANKNWTKNTKTDCCRIAMVINGWDTRKNPEPALRAFSHLRSTSYPNLELHLFGAGYGPGERAEVWARKKNCQLGMQFHGRTAHSKLLEQLRSMDFMVHPALEESCPMGIAEALALGLPVIGGSSSGGVPWVIGNGGLTTDVCSSNEIAAAMQHLISEPDIRDILSTNAKQHASNVFTSKIVSELYEVQYLRAVNINSQM